VAAILVAATFVMPGFSLTCGIVGAAVFGVLLPPIKDFFWIAMQFLQSRFFDACDPNSLQITCIKHGSCQNHFRRWRYERHAKSMSCNFHSEEIRRLPTPVG
jgi:hypothetical protein